MKELRKTSVGTAVVFERLADDGWPEDAGWWPERIGGFPLRPVNSSPERLPGIRRPSLLQVIKSLLPSRNRA